MEGSMPEKKKILIIDDEEDFGKMVKLNLERTGEFDVKYETRGGNAISAAREFQPHLIFLDVIIPDVDGGEIMANLRDTSGVKDIPIVFLTAIITDKEASQQEGIVAGRPFLAKPVTTAKLIACINKYLT
jgi:CheY-like chemotaxis protein